MMSCFISKAELAGTEAVFDKQCWYQDKLYWGIASNKNFSASGKGVKLTTKGKIKIKPSMCTGENIHAITS